MPDAPRLDGPTDPLYLTDADGVRWRVHHADYRHFRVLRRLLGAPNAGSRYFVSEAGVRRVYQFKKADDHSLQLATLLRQLSSAGWAARERFDSAKVTPT